jgi:hypothetical protein
VIPGHSTGSRRPMRGRRGNGSCSVLYDETRSERWRSSRLGQSEREWDRERAERRCGRERDGEVVGLAPARNAVWAERRLLGASGARRDCLGSALIISRVRLRSAGVSSAGRAATSGQSAVESQQKLSGSEASAVRESDLAQVNTLGHAVKRALIQRWLSRITRPRQQDDDGL